MKPKSPLEKKKLVREAIPQNVILRPFFFLGGPPRFPAGRPVKNLVREAIPQNVILRPVSFLRGPSKKPPGSQNETQKGSAGSARGGDRKVTRVNLANIPGRPQGYTC